ncbi:branched-chain amino acid ABC transporter permease [Oceanobacillus zhaokaii]|jgi:branched-chain amino acid transport system permease protein|uniref:Branched-chain amino acid ABC transporter permease n=1 Tax=Oceanobacillus zhaokaii TaxID=2052660 RepID=A0A345PDV5_9BACI|nr:branched-chain amino acid ABC transporter permease [Oceanobacillus zhaokaii]AXI08185.1 branched-chain amino acid ABC transporter permease [Oceanobacillus zhaokaii]
MNLAKVEKSTWIYLIFSLLLVIVPFIVTGRSMQFIIIQFFIFAIFAMSYDILLGYTGIISFGHVMFFGIGAYSTAIVMNQFDSTVLSFILAIIIAIVLAAIVSLIVGVLTLRLKSHFYAMLTLALAGLFLVGAEKWRSLTGGNDGFTFKLPEILRDSQNFYMLCLLSLVLIFFGLRRLTKSPFGRVLMAIRENEKRTESLGYKIVHYKVIASVVAGVVASFAGVLYSISLRFVNTSVFATDMTIDVLLMTIIGGVGTLIGPIIGAGLVEFAHHWLSSLADVHWIFERWIILYGIVYILVVIFFPLGIVGTIQKKFFNRQNFQKKKQQNHRGKLEEGRDKDEIYRNG